MSVTHPDYVTIHHGMRGYFAVLMMWNPEYGGFYEPYSTGFGSYDTYQKAIPEAKAWAKAEDIELKV